MLTGYDENGNIRNVKVTENGEVLINQKEVQEKPNATTLLANVITLNTDVQNINLNKEITEINIANYSENSDVSVNVDNIIYIIGSNIAVDLPINKTVEVLGLSATEENTKVQYVIKGVEQLCLLDL